MPRYLCSIPTIKGSGPIHEIISDDEVAIAAFIKTWDREGRNLYECVSSLKDGATRRCLETVGTLGIVHVDIDLRALKPSQEEVLAKLRALPLALEIRESGGGYHIVPRLREPVEAGTPEFDRVNAVRKRLTRALCGDPIPDHAAALLRVVGSHNFKYGEAKLCQVILPGEPVDVTELEELADILGDNPLFERAEEELQEIVDDSTVTTAPLDIEEKLANVRFEGGHDGVHWTELRVSAALVNRGMAVETAVEEVLAATRDKLAGDERCAKWDWYAERRTIAKMAYDFINKKPELYQQLPDELRTHWEAVLAKGERPKICGGDTRPFHVRGYTHKEETEKEAPKTKRRQKPHFADVEINWWTAVNPIDIPPRSFLFGRHYQRSNVSLTTAPGGQGKTSQVLLDLTSMSLGRDLLTGATLPERLRCWYHNAEDTTDEITRRVVAICQKYGISQKDLDGWLAVTTCEQFDLKVANGFTELKLDHRTLDAMQEKIRKMQLDVVGLDPLINLHTTDEDKNVKMAQVIGAFRDIAQEERCAIEVEQHTKKTGTGANGEYVGMDGRGAGSQRDAVRSQRVLNIMSREEALRLGLQEHERKSYLRVDTDKTNNSPPQAAEWRRIVNVGLPNGDDVGVIEAWNYPGQGNAEERAEMEKAAETAFMAILARFADEGRIVGDSARGNYAPRIFAKEREAHEPIRITENMFKGAMSRLFATGKIRQETQGAGGRAKQTIVAV